MILFFISVSILASERLVDASYLTLVFVQIDILVNTQVIISDVSDFIRRY